MSKLEKVYLSLAKLQKIKNRGITASELSEYISLDRTNVSRYLNKLYKENRVDKVVGRPVVYSISRIDSNKCILEDKIEDKVEENSFDKMVGAKLSLEMQIQQAKAAILYPPHGLHTLILGETGVGKSMFAEYMYLFGKESGSIREDASFVRFNCADYADNPQLVIAQIFGVKKGAYTGADKDRIGLLKKADNGILFLDEIHRLSPQAQEMLFTYIDKGCFRPLGETEKLEYSNAQIISATTEDPNSFMLKTFTRRIPMIITLPALKERTIQERYYLLEQFIKAESMRLKTNIYFNKNVIISFLLYECPNNIGQLKSDIQLACAKAFLNYKTKEMDIILVEQGDIHTRVKKGLMKLKDHRGVIEKLLDDKGDLLKFSYKDDNIDIKEDTENKCFYDSIEKKYVELKNKGIDEKKISGILNVDIDTYFKSYIENLNGKYRKDEITKIVDISVVNKVEEILNLASEKLNRRYDERVYFGLALHLQGVLERIRRGTKIYHPKLNFIKTQYAEEFYIAMEGAKIIEDTFDLNIPLDEIGYLTMFIATKSNENSYRDIDRVKVIVIMHGNSTASSMAEVANKLIGEDYIVPLDMPLNMKAEDMYIIAKNKAIEINQKKGILFLVDMGSLTNFGEMINEETGIEIKTVDMTSTLVAIEGGRKALSGKSLDEIYKSCLEISRDSVIGRKLVSNIRKNVIITACFTGEGSAEKLKEIIGENIKCEDGIKIISLNILDRKDFLEKIEALRETYNIVAIVGTVNINVDNIPFIQATSILADDGIERLNKLLNYEEDFNKITKSINSQLTNIDGIKLVSLVRSSILEIEERLELVIPHEVKIGIIIHLCFLIDKTIRGDKGIDFEKLNEYRKLHSKEFIMVKQSLRTIEIMYNINIGDNQLAFIVRMVLENSISV